MARDNFPKSVISTLRERVAHRCSNPSCRVPTSAPSSNAKVNSIGIAAHICAASPGGARYDSSMTTQERKSLSNGIWLCSNCSIDIDRDESSYSVSMLHNWKETAENLARKELGKKLPSASETIDTLTAALTGHPKNFIASAISNVHQATAKSLESLDTRFLIKTAYNDGDTSMAIYAKEDVSLTVNIDRENAKEYAEKHQQLVDHGKDLEISSSVLNIKGSKLFEELLEGNEGTIRISGKKLRATQKLWLVDKTTNQIETFEEIHGDLNVGTKTFSFSGSSCKDIFSFSYQDAYVVSRQKANVTISLCLDIWEGQNFNLLPFFQKLSSFFEKMATGWELFMSLEIDGITVFSSNGIDVSDWDYIKETHNILKYLNFCKIISNKFGLNLLYTSNISFSSDDFKYIADVVDTIEGRKTYNITNLISNPSCRLLVGNSCDNVKLLTNVKEPNFVKIVQDEGGEIELLGTKIKLPPKVISLHSVLPKIHSDIESLKEGDEVKVEWLPQENFKYSESYE